MRAAVEARREAMSNTTRRRLEQLQDIGHQVDVALAFMIGREHGVFGHLIDGPTTLDAIASVTGLVARRLGPALDLLVHAGLLERPAPGTYGLVPGDAELHAPDGPWFHQIGPPDIDGLFGKRLRALDVLVTDVAPGTVGTGSTRAAGQRDFLQYLDREARAVAAEVARLTSLVHTPRRILDIGSGLGTYAYALLDLHPDAEAVLLDRPRVGTLATEHAQAVGHGTRTRFVGLDLFDAEAWPTAADTVVLSNLLHCYSMEKAQWLLGRAVDALAPGGLVAIKDFDRDADGLGPAWAVRFHFLMALMTEGGTIIEPADVDPWLLAAGLEPWGTFALREDRRSYLVLARKPTSAA